MAAPSWCSNLVLKVIVLLLSVTNVVADSKFRCTVTGKTYLIKGSLS